MAASGGGKDCFLETQEQTEGSEAALVNVAMATRVVQILSLLETISATATFWYAKR